MNKASINKDVGILLLGHGSKLPYNHEVVDAVAKMIEEKHKLVVRTAYLNMEKPTIQEGLEAFSGSGVKKIVAVPIFLAHGVHTLQDIPGELGLSGDSKKTIVMVDGSKVEVSYAEPLGVDKRIADIAIQRAEEILK